jgi:hypothetical protein
MRFESDFGKKREKRTRPKKGKGESKLNASSFLWYQK